MLNIIIESPFLPNRTIKLDENKWTIEKLINMLSSKIKVLGKPINKNAVYYELVCLNCEIYKICKIKDYPLNIKVFVDKLLNTKKIVPGNLSIKILLSSTHFKDMSNSVKLLNTDTLDNFIERRSIQSAKESRESIVNLDNSDLKTMELNKTGLQIYSAKYKDYKVSVESKWTNLLMQMKDKGVIGNNKPISSNKVISGRTGDIEESIDNIEEIIDKLDKVSDDKSSIKKDSQCCCFKIFIKNNVSEHQDFDDNFRNIDSHNIDIIELSYHDDNILDQTETTGTMFYTWSEGDDLLLE
jgi:hypothetical protein